MTDKLKPCPFCGGEAGIVKTNKTETGEKYVVGCMHCGVELPFAFKTEKQATEYWNRRQTMTDNEIIKALEYCKDCSANLNVEIINLITRQQAENENLKVENQSLRSAANSLKIHYEEAQAEIERLNKVYQANQQLINALNKSYFLAKAEAYKEFAKKLKEKYGIFTPLGVNWIEAVKAVRVSDIDKILKETVGE